STDRRERPGDLVVESPEAATHRTAGPRRMAQYLRRVLAGELRPARRLAKGASMRPHRDPRVVADQYVLDLDHQRIAALCALQPDRPGDRIGFGRNTVEAAAQRRDGLVVFRLEVTGAGIPRFDLKTL